MPAYIVFIRESEIHNPEEMAIYQNFPRGNAPTPKPTPLAVYGSLEALEGAAPDGMVILQFDSMDDARAWYNNPEYQKRAAHRINAADYRAILVDGLPPR
jgi:uncharacterized protein (DUF1330 family)